MSRKVLFNLALIVFLLLMFPLLWFFNQRIINYQKFLTLDSKFSLNVNTKSSEELSSVTYVLRFLNDNDISADLDVDVKSPDDFGVMGRKIVVNGDVVEVYEYSSNEDALKRMRSLAKDSELTGNIYLYKNLLIYNKDNILEVESLMEDLIDEKMD